MLGDRFKELTYNVKLLAEQVDELEAEYAMLWRETKDLISENEKLKSQLENSPKKSELIGLTPEVLKFALEKDAYGIDARDVAHKYKISKAMAYYHVGILFDKKFIVVLSLRMGDANAVFQMSPQGRAYCVENKLTS
jgi:regulator of replication initiation timing